MVPTSNRLQPLYRERKTREVQCQDQWPGSRDVEVIPDSSDGLVDPMTERPWVGDKEVHTYRWITWSWSLPTPDSHSWPVPCVSIPLCRRCPVHDGLKIDRGRGSQGPDVGHLFYLGLQDSPLDHTGSGCRSISINPELKSTKLTSTDISGREVVSSVFSSFLFTFCL